MSPVGIAKEVGEHVDVDVDTSGAEGADDGEDVVGGPARHEGAQDQGYRLQRLLGPVFRLDFLLLLPAEPDPLAYLVDQVLAVSGRPSLGLWEQLCNKSVFFFLSKFL